MNDIIISVASSFVASFLFLYAILIIYKPKFSISSTISYGKISNGDGQNWYSIKICNKSLFPAYDVKFELHQGEFSTAGTPGKHNRRLTKLPLVRDNVSYIKGSFSSYFGNDTAEYACRVRTGEDLRSILTDDHKEVVFQVTSRHGLTGLTKVHTMVYSNSNAIVNGSFEYGMKMVVN
ncbi:MAG: hypothetical protein IPO65_15740 [Saprospiraceae bacterium]|nr:hypothetical protein [Saprospiraceae bacterium]